jgi:hypothetical protein
MGKDRKTRFVRLLDFLRQTNSEIVGGLGLGGGLRTLYIQLSILKTEERALKLSDLWIEQEERSETLLARNRITKRLLDVPLECLTPSLRRHSGVDNLDVTEKYDFLVTNTFSGIDEFLNDKKIEQRFEKNRKMWKEYVERRKGNVFVRGNLISLPRERD